MVSVTIDHLSKSFGGPTPAVDDVSLQIPAGNLFFLLGPSGCGKTTLLRMIAGFALPTRGRILFDGNDISQVPPHLRDTGMVFQSYALWPHMTVAENVGFGLDVRKVANPQRAERIAQALALVRLDGLGDRKPNQLSGGQQQRVALARALAIRPKCLLLDEPLSNLDAKLRLEMRTEIRRIVKEVGTTAIYVTHDQKEALSMADGIAVLRAGKLEQTGTPEQLYRLPRTQFVAGFIGESNFLPATIQSIDGDFLVLKTAAGPILAPKDAKREGGPQVGDKAVVAFRPESARLLDEVGSVSEGREGAENRLPGRLISSAYLGEVAEHLVAVNGVEMPLKIFELNPKPGRFAAGRGVAISLAPEQVMLVDA